MFRTNLVNKSKKVALNDGAYECQGCGNRHVGEDDRFCTSCWTKFADKSATGSHARFGNRLPLSVVMAMGYLMAS